MRAETLFQWIVFICQWLQSHLSTMLWTKLIITCFLLATLSQLGELKSLKKTASYIEYVPGTTNVIIAAPHGGDEKPSSIPDRDAGCYIGGTCIYAHDCGVKDFDNCKVSTAKDMYTRETAQRVADSFQQQFGVKPYVVINHLHRSKMDANREINEAAFQVAEAELAWFEFQNFINESKRDINGRALFIDLHGQSHSEEWVELGYLISSKNLDAGSFKPEDTSVRTLAAVNSHIPFDEVIRGLSSMGYQFQEKGIETVPSPQHPGPNGGGYYSGGHNTRVHGSRYGGTVDAIQIELPRYLRYEDKCETFCPELAEIIYSFVTNYF